MNAEARRRAADSLRAHRLEAAYLVARLDAHARTRPLKHGLEARGVAIDRYFHKDADVAVRVARALAELHAAQERGEEAGLTEAQARLGALRAERTRLDARLAAELHAFATTKTVLQIRLSRLG